jgi:hypothetical protein
MAIMVLHCGGPKEDLWLQENNAKYEDAVFAAPNIAQYGLDYPHFVKLMWCFTIPTYGDNTDPFDPIRLFTDICNAAIHSALAPGRILTVDESMALWKGKSGKYGGNGSMLGWMFVARKPTNCGRESHTTADYDTGCIIFVEPYEGKERMAKKELCNEYNKDPAKAMRCTKQWFNTGRAAIVDIFFASMTLARGLADNGMYMIGKVKTGHSKFPRKWLLSKAKMRGQRASCTSTLKVGNHEWELLAAVDCNKQPMCLLGTAGTTAMGDTLTRNYSTLRADGTSSVQQRTLEQWDIHATSRGSFNPIDMHNNKRHGPISFEDTWKTHRWWVLEFQMLMGMAEVNAFLLWGKFKPGHGDCTPEMFRRRLAYQMLYHPVLMREIGERATLSQNLSASQTLQRNPTKDSNSLSRSMRLACKFCGQKTMWSCSFVPWMDGMEKRMKRGCMFIYSPAQNPDCFASHVNGAEPRSRLSVAMVQAWVKRKARKAASSAGGQVESE